MDIIPDLTDHFWNYIVFISVAGALGGVGNILISGEFQPWRKVVNQQSKTTHYSIGSLKEPFVGAIGGILTTLLFIESGTGQYLLYLSMLTGFGSSAFLKRYIDQKTNQIIEESNVIIQGENIQPYHLSDENSIPVVKGMMSQPPVYLTEEEVNRLTTLRCNLAESIGPREAKVFQSEIKVLLHHGKQRAL